MKTALVVALLAPLLACSAPPDKGLTRPQSVKATPFAQKDITINGMRLRYIDEGKGPPLLILPGLTSRIEEFDQMTGLLKDRFRVLVFDFPGSGYSDKPDRPYSMDFYEESVLGFLDALGVKKCRITGGSLGGNLALRLALRAPERFDKILAWAPGASWPAKPALFRFLHALTGYYVFWPVVKAQSRYWYSPDFAGKDAALNSTFTYYREIMSPGFIRMYFDLACESFESSLQDIAAKIPQPVLLVWGDRDDGGGMAAGVARLHALIPHNDLLVFPGARHSLALERPKELSQAIVEYLGKP